VIGTGSYLPELWSETYATADIIAYDGVPMVKAGREFLLRHRREPDSNRALGQSETAAGP
jgi:nicotinate phosphoribosyltransferase